MKYGLLSTCRALLKPSWVRRGCVEKHTNPIVTSPKMNLRDVREVDSLLDLNFVNGKQGNCQEPSFIATITVLECIQMSYIYLLITKIVNSILYPSKSK